MSPPLQPPNQATERKASFFRQSGWLMFANIAAGGLMWAVHFLSKRIPESEYSVVGTLFALTMVVPVLPLRPRRWRSDGRRSSVERFVAVCWRFFWSGCCGRGPWPCFTGN
jgi:hypothetical protein